MDEETKHFLLQLQLLGIDLSNKAWYALGDKTYLMLGLHHFSIVKGYKKARVANHIYPSLLKKIVAIQKSNADDS